MISQRSFLKTILRCFLFRSQKILKASSGKYCLNRETVPFPVTMLQYDGELIFSNRKLSLVSCIL